MPNPIHIFFAEESYNLHQGIYLIFSLTKERQISHEAQMVKFSLSIFVLIRSFAFFNTKLRIKHKTNIKGITE